jgi:hypothetical protein
MFKGIERETPIALLHVAANELHEHFDIPHVTLQLESESFALTCNRASGQPC